MTIINYLTFDDGPSAGSDVVLNTLREFSVPAVFFLTGDNAASAGGTRRQKELALRMQNGIT